MAKSIYSEPMPSPNGTNYERLFIVRKPFAEAMALDAAMSVGGPKGSPNFASYNAKDDDPTDVDFATRDNEGYDLEDKVRQLLEGKLDPGDIDALCALIDPDTDTAPAPAQDRRRQARDQRLTMPSRAEMERRVAASGEIRAAQAQKNYADLCQRFPAMKNARVVG